jgi:hypothetical protein
VKRGQTYYNKIGASGKNNSEYKVSIHNKEHKSPAATLFIS